MHFSLRTYAIQMLFYEWLKAWHLATKCKGMKIALDKRANSTSNREIPVTMVRQRNKNAPRKIGGVISAG